MSLADERKSWEEGALQAPLPLNTVITPMSIEGVACEWVRVDQTDDKTVILYVHGGGFNAGSCKTHRELAALLSQASQVPVLLIDYRLAPEHPFPAGLEDVIRVYHWLLIHHTTSNRIVIGGDSAGAGLALSALVALRDAADDPLPAAGLFLSPWFDLTLSGETITSRAEVDPMVTQKALAHAVQLYIGSARPDDPLVSPLYADLKGLPPLLIQTGDHEILSGDAIRAAEKVKAADGEVELEIWPEMWHVWQSFAAQLPEGQQAIDRIGVFVQEKLGV
jgi:acetyl esterase/lipase